MSSIPMRQRMEEFVYSLQDQIVTAFEKLDPKSPPFKRDVWTRIQGGGGRSCIFAVPPNDEATSTDSHIPVLEKGGVNVSVVHGRLPTAAVKQMRADHSSIPVGDYPDGLPFFAAGISLVIHPLNPHAPTSHANYRYFELTEPSDPDSLEPPKVLAWWFGGGADLTPSYLYEEDVVHFHSSLKEVCDRHGPQLYPTFKKWCDDYFYITHRKETRGVGGIFFDDICSEDHKLLGPVAEMKRPVTADEIFEFVRDLGNAYIPSYLPILSIRHSIPYTPRQRRWQLLRRGRYVEFNLVYDRGTKFGLMTPEARIESILMSLPETARWEYMSPLGEEEGTEEARLLEVVREPRNWV